VAAARENKPQGKGNNWEGKRQGVDGRQAMPTKRSIEKRHALGEEMVKMSSGDPASQVGR